MRFMTLSMIIINFVHLLNVVGDLLHRHVVELVYNADDPAVVAVDVRQPHWVLLLARRLGPEGHDAIDLHLAPGPPPGARPHIGARVPLSAVVAGLALIPSRAAGRRLAQLTHLARVAADAVGADARVVAEVLSVDLAALIVGDGLHLRLPQQLAHAALVLRLSPAGHDQTAHANFEYTFAD